MGACAGLARVALFVRLVARMIAATDRHLLASETYRPDSIVGGDARIGNVIEYMFSSIHDVRMSTAAAMVSMNESTFSRHFKKMTGANFVECVRKIRIAKACTLLESDDLGITEICFECGFQNISNFNRTFRREKGMTPTRIPVLDQTAPRWAGWPDRLDEDRPAPRSSDRPASLLVAGGR